MRLSTLIAMSEDIAEDYGCRAPEVKINFWECYGEDVAKACIKHFKRSLYTPTVTRYDELDCIAVEGTAYTDEGVRCKVEVTAWWGGYE